MALIDHPITKRWPPRNPDNIQLYSFPTPNGVKVSAMLEETGLGYDAHTVSIRRDDQLTPEFLSLNPNNKIPAIIDPKGRDGRMISLFESGAILMYLAEKTGMFLSDDPVLRAETLQWLMFQMGGLGPMTGQLGFFHKFAGAEIEDKTAKNRYVNEVKRLLAVLDNHLEGREFMIRDGYSIADITLWPWIRALNFYEAEEIVGLAGFANIIRWRDLCLSRPASTAALNIPSREA